MKASAKTPNLFSKLLQALMAVGGTSVLSQVLVMLQTLLLARWIGPELNAYVLAAFNVASLGMILINMGFDHWLLQRTAIDVENSHKNLGLLLSFKLFFGILLGLVLVVALPNLRKEIYIPIILGLAFLDVLTDSLSGSLYTYHYAIDQYKRASITLTISRVLRLTSTLVLILFKIKALPWFLGLRLLVNVSVLAYLWSFLKPEIGLINWRLIKTISKNTWAFGLAEILNFAYDRLDLTLLAFLSLVTAEISYYGTASNMLLTGIATLLPLHFVLVPYIINQQKIRNSSQQASTTSKMALYVQPLLLLLGAGLLGALFLFFFGETTVNLLLGAAYRPAGPLLRLASPLVLLKSGTIALSSFLIAREQQNLKLAPLAIVTILKTTLILAFYKPYGLNGMIITFIFCEFLLLVFYAIQLWRSRGYKSPSILEQEEVQQA